jgi:hypothetical protein
VISNIQKLSRTGLLPPHSCPEIPIAARSLLRGSSILEVSIHTKFHLCNEVRSINRFIAFFSTLLGYCKGFKYPLDTIYKGIKYKPP